MSELLSAYSTLAPYLLILLLVIIVRAKFKQYQKYQYFLTKDVANVENQKRFVSTAFFYKRPLMNKSEYWLYCMIENWLSTVPNKGYRLFAQVPMGEYLGTEDQSAFRSINSKRVDFLVIDRKGKAIAALEYQGAGHYQGNSLDRDEVKRIAHDRAGVPWIEIHPGDDSSAVADKLNSALGATARG